MGRTAAENSPKSKCWPPGLKCVIVLFEQDSHRKVSETKSPGFADGTPGTDWQSHHLLCVSAMTHRDAGSPKKTQELNDALYITDWNINEKENMLGMPMYQKYKQSYGDIEKMPDSAQTAMWNSAKPDKGKTPGDIPAHNIDHGMYYYEVIGYLKENIWTKFKADGEEQHDTDAAFLKNELNYAAEYFQELLLDVRGVRTTHDTDGVAGSGTVAAWKNRFADVRWADPFSMAETPKLRKRGSPSGALGEIFKRLQT